MCIIIASPNGVGAIPERHLETSYDRNPDGAGFMWSEDSKLYLRKGYFDYRCLSRALQSVNPTAPVVVHMRIATSGHIDTGNCHPFALGVDSTTGLSSGVAHNGVLQYRTKPGASDTRCFTRDILRPLYKTGALGLKCLDGIQHLIGEYNKLVFLRSDGVIRIVNEYKGDWINGVWYSNDSYKPRKVYVPMSSPVKPRSPSHEYLTWEQWNSEFDSTLYPVLNEPEVVKPASWTCESCDELQTGESAHSTFKICQACNRAFSDFAEVKI